MRRPTSLRCWKTRCGELFRDVGKPRLDLHRPIGARRWRLYLLVVVGHGRGVLEEVPGEDRHDAIARADRARANQLASAGDARGARRLAPDAGGVDDRFRLENLVVRYGDDHTIRFADRPNGPVVGRGVPYVDRGGERARLDAVTAGESLARTQREGRRDGGLHRGHARQPREVSPLPGLSPGLPEGGGIAQVSRRYPDPVGRPPAELPGVLHDDP